MEKYHGLTQGTDLEAAIDKAAQNEACGTMTYYALARMAREQGLEELARELVFIGDQESEHAGFYHVLNGRCPEDFWNLLRSMRDLERGARDRIRATAAKVRELGAEDAAGEIELFAEQEANHGRMLARLIEQYAPPKEEYHGPVWVCPVCGYRYEGEIGEEPESYVCPICRQPKSVFVKEG